MRPARVFPDSRSPTSSLWRNSLSEVQCREPRGSEHARRNGINDGDTFVSERFLIRWNVFGNDDRVKWKRCFYDTRARWSHVFTRVERSGTYRAFVRTYFRYRWYLKRASLFAVFSKILLVKRTTCQQTRYFTEYIRDKYPICCCGARYKLFEKELFVFVKREIRRAEI